MKIEKTTPISAAKTHAATNNIKEDKKSIFSDWLSDKDKICTDGSNDGVLTPLEAGASFVKGLGGIVKTAINHPVMTGLTVAGGVGLTVATGGAILPAMTAFGGIIGGGTVINGAYKAYKAETDADAKYAFEQMGNGVFAIGASALSAKSALNKATEAGVEACKNLAGSNPIKNLINCIKVVPDAIKTSANNIKTAILPAAITNEQLALPEHTETAEIIDVKYAYPNGVQAESLDNVVIYKNNGLAPSDVKYTYPDGTPADCIEEVVSSYVGLREAANEYGINISEMDADSLGDFFKTYREGFLQARKELQEQIAQILQDKVDNAPTVKLSDFEDFMKNGGSEPPKA